MKKSHALGLLGVVMLAVPLFSAEINAGIKGGGNLQNMWSIDKGISRIRLGGAGGLFLRIRLAEIFALQPEVLYAMKGGEAQENHPEKVYTGLIKMDTSIIFETKLKSVEAPLLFKFFPVGGVSSQPNLFFGPYYEFMFKRDLKAKYSGIRESTVTSLKGRQPEPGTDNQHNYGLVIGGGIDFGLGTFDLRYTIGFQNVEVSGDEPAGMAAKLRTRTGTLSVMIGFLFGMS